MQPTQREPEVAEATHRRTGGWSVDYRTAWHAALTRLRGLPRPSAVTLFWLGFAILLCPPIPMMPAVGLDPSWIIVVNVFPDWGLQFGQDIAFTYGPWAVLEVPMGLTARALVLGTLFAIAAAAALYVALFLALSRTVSSPVAAPIAALATAAAAPVAAGGRVVCAAVVASVLLLLRERRGSDDRLRLWASVGLGITASLLFQIKVSHGVMTLIPAAIVALTARSFRAAAVSAAAGAVAWVAGFGLWWLLAGQQLGNIPVYVRAAMEFSRGYPEAMQFEIRGRSGYLLGVVLGLVVASAAFLVVRRRDRIAGVGLALLTAVTVWLAAKHGFSRHEPGHEAIFVVMAAMVLVALAAGLARRGRIFIVVALVALAQVATLSTFDPFAAQRTWRSTLESSLYGFDGEKAGSITDIRAGYALPDELLDLVGDHPVQVDPWDAVITWAYGLNWRPVPVFQQYAAYTRYLDELNARAIAQAPADQVILRHDQQSVDGRNPVWDPPLYQLTVLCTYTTVASEAGWSVLRHGADRCSTPRDLGSLRVEAGEVVRVPSVADDEVLVARVVPDPDDLITRAAEFVYKPWRTVYVTAGGTGYRVPKAHLAGPLLLSVPAQSDAPSAYAGFSHRQISLNISGTVQFEAIRLR